MTASVWENMLKQVKNKPAKLARVLKFNKKRVKKTHTPRCIICKRYGAIIGRYGLQVCRQCFREIARELGFWKYGHG